MTSPTPPSTGNGVKPPADAVTLWDRYALAIISNMPQTTVQNAARIAADFADAMMAERRKRGVR